MTQNVNMELFRKALIETRNRKIDEILMEYPDDVIPSARHKKKMQQLIKNDGTYYPVRKRVLIALIAALLALLAGCTIYIKRNEIASFYEEIYEKYAVVYLPEETNNQPPTSIEEEYKLTYIPDGYQLYSEVASPINVSMTWENSNGDIISFNQSSSNTLCIFDSDRSDSQIVEINGIQIYYRKREDSYVYLWTDEQYFYTVTCTEEFSDDIIIKIINGVKKLSR